MEITVRIVGVIIVILDLITRPIFWLFSRIRKKRKLPPIDDPLLLTSATKLAALVRSKKVKSADLVKLFIKRAQDVNPLINAIVEERFSLAFNEAIEVDKYLENIKDENELKKLEKSKPFLGVPITVKESCSVSGMSLCGGSLPRLGTKATVDGEAVRLMRSAGAIPILVSNTPELCLSWESTNFVTGRTCNPYDLHRTSGGSSGGEAALIASGASVCGIGSDIAGSIRLPALFCGIFGHKPSPGIISIEGHYPNSSDESFAKFLTVGPLARYSEDLMPMLKVMAGENAKCLDLDIPVDLKKLKVSYMLEAGKSIAMIPVEKDIQIAMKNVIEYLREDCGSKIDEVKFQDLEESVEIAISVFFKMQDIPNMLKSEENPKHDKSLLFELIKTSLGLGTITMNALSFLVLHKTNLFIPKSRTGHYVERANELRKKFEDALGTNGVFLYPTFPTSAFHHNQVSLKVAGVLYTMIFNVLGMPSTHVPLGFNSQGLPIGIQIIAAPNQDRLCLAVAKELDKKFGGWMQPKL